MAHSAREDGDKLGYCSAIDDLRALSGGGHGTEVVGGREGGAGAICELQESPHLEFPLEAGRGKTRSARLASVPRAHTTPVTLRAFFERILRARRAYGRERDRRGRVVESGSF